MDDESISSELRSTKYALRVLSTLMRSKPTRKEASLWEGDIFLNGGKGKRV
jgi:hypothetical protein